MEVSEKFCKAEDMYGLKDEWNSILGFFISQASIVCWTSRLIKLFCACGLFCEKTEVTTKHSEIITSRNKKANRIFFTRFKFIW